MSDLSRRTFLQIAGALAAAACGGQDGADGPDPLRGDDPGDGAAPASPPDANPSGDGGATVDGGPPDRSVPGIDLDALPVREAEFPYGVMAGDATADSAMLWTRYSGAGGLLVQIELEEGAGGRAVLSREVAAAERGDGGFVHVDASGLAAGARYRYAFVVSEGGKPVARGPFGLVRAALAPGALEVVTFAGTSCTHQNGAPYPVLAEAAKRKVDFFLHGGDHVYTDAGADDAMTLPQYRAKYAQAWAAAGMKALHGSTGMILAWDDHEIANNWNPETFPAARLDAARRAFFEHRATRRDPAAPNRLWRSFAWGKTLEVIVLDVRSERLPSTRDGANAQFISPLQMAWLKQRLSQSQAVFKLVLTSVPISNFPLSAAGESDKWEGYPAQRDDILAFVRDQKLTGVVWLSGDLHFGCVGSVGTSEARMKMREILMGPGGTDANNPDLPAPQFERVIGEKNFTLFKADPVARQLTVEFVGEGGTIFKNVYPA